MNWSKIDLRDALEHARNVIFDNPNIVDLKRKEMSEPPTEERITDFFTFKDGTALAFTLGRTYDASTECTPMTETIASEVWLYD